MKTITLLVALLLSPPLQAMEQPIISESEQPNKIISSLYQMTSEQLTDFSKNITTLFSKLENEGLIKTPFDDSQAKIFIYSYKGTLPEIADIKWTLDVEATPTAHGLDILQLLELYTNILHVKRPHTSHHLFPCSYLQCVIPFLETVFPYAHESSNIRSINNGSLIPLSELAHQKDRVDKIIYHFSQVRTSFLDLPHSSPWQWLRMRHHLEKVAKNYHQNHFKNAPTFYELIAYNTLIPRANDVQETSTFRKNIQEGVQLLTTKLNIPLDNLEQDGHNLPNCRKIIKVLFSELPHLQDFKESKTSQPFNVTMSFLNLYLSLTHNYFSGDATIKSSKMTKFHAFLKGIIGDDLTQDQLMKIWSTSNGQDNIKGLLTSIKNPFNPQIREINAYNYYADQISLMLNDLQEPQIQTSPDHDPPLATAMMNDLNELYSYVSGFLSPWWAS